MLLFVLISLLVFIYVFILSFCNSCLRTVFSLFLVQFVMLSSIFPSILTYFFICSLFYSLFHFYVFYIPSVFLLSFLAPVPFVSFFPTVFILMFVRISLQLCNLDSSLCLISGFRRWVNK